MQLVTKDLTTTSEIIAKNTNRAHKDTLALIKLHIVDLQEVGRVTFETIPIETAGGVQHKEIAILDDYASMLLITHMRSIGIVKDFKRELVIEFKRMREYLRNESHRELEKFQAVIENQSKELRLTEKREPRDEQTLAVIMGCSSARIRPIHDLLERNGYLTRQSFIQTYYNYSPTKKLGNICVGRKGSTLLFDYKVKELVTLLMATESLFD